MQFESGVRMMNQGNELGLLQLLDASALSEDVPDQREAIRRFWAIGHGLRRHTLTYVLGGDSMGQRIAPTGTYSPRQMMQW